jgi:hypothetical protein
VITHVAAHIAETVRADDYAGMQDDPVADGHSVFQKNIGMNYTIIADGYVVANLGTGANLRS